MNFLRTRAHSGAFQRKKLPDCPRATIPKSNSKASSDSFEAVNKSRDFQPWVYGGPLIEVAKYDGSLQCEMGRPVSLVEMEKELRAANIAVQAKAKKADGIQHPQMCGASTGTMNVYRINTSDWEKARVLGFVLYIEGISIARDRRTSNVAMRP